MELQSLQTDYTVQTECTVYIIRPNFSKYVGYVKAVVMLQRSKIFPGLTHRFPLNYRSKPNVMLKKRKKKLKVWRSLTHYYDYVCFRC